MVPAEQYLAPKEQEPTHVSQSDGLPSPRVLVMHRLAARLSRLARPAKGFVSQPEPRTIGSFARGRQLVAGNFQFAGRLVEAKGVPIWDLATGDGRFDDEIHGFRWLDDLAAVSDGPARERAQAWTFGWIDRYGTGKGPGWLPELTGRRLIRWVNHAIFLLNGQSPAATRAFFRSLGRQTRFLSQRWRAAPAGLPRIEALTGLIYAGLSLTGLERYVAPASAALARECRDRVDAEGGIPSRNPEELLEVLTLLTWAASALSGSGRAPERDHLAAIARIAPTLRALRQADGGLARFHGGERGLDGWLDQALAEAHALSGGKALTAHGLAMGYGRLSAGRTTVVIDAGAPPKGAASKSAHASTLAFEMTSGRRPVIVNCGSGAAFGAEWHRAGRATPSHSTLGIRGVSSSRLRGDAAGAVMVTAPDQVWAQTDSGHDGQRLLAGHNGYAGEFGLTHVRQLSLSVDGRMLAGEDTLGAMTAIDRRRFEVALEASRMAGVPFDIRFHLHPDVDSALDLGGTAVSLALKSGEIWVFRHDGTAELALEPSVYLQAGRLKPRPARQIVLSAVVLDYACQIGWTLAKAHDTPAAIRDTGRDDDPADD